MVDTFAPQASLIGVKLGKYAVQALIGRGAMAAVYLAKDSDLGRPVALKVLLGSTARNPEQVRRFQMEAMAAAPLQHANIVRIYDAGILNGVPFIAMEYVEGESLEHFLQRSGAWSRGSMRCRSRCRSRTRWTARTARASSTAT
jgi:serine/threonine protein kinase